MNIEYIDEDIENDNKIENLKGDYEDNGEEDWTYRKPVDPVPDENDNILVDLEKE